MDEKPNPHESPKAADTVGRKLLDLLVVTVIVVLLIAAVAAAGIWFVDLLDNASG